MSTGQEITTDDLPRDLLAENSLTIKDKNWGDVLESWILGEFNKNSIDISKNIDSIYESVLIKSSLKLSSGNKTEAAKILGWGRNTITNKIKKLRSIKLNYFLQYIPTASEILLISSFLIKLTQFFIYFMSNIWPAIYH